MEGTDEVDGGDVLFRWAVDGATTVLISGSWSNWREKAVLEVEHDVFGRGKLFSGILHLPYGEHLFLFLVDGEWKCNPKVKNEEGCFAVVAIDGQTRLEDDADSTDI
ncbi:unnamed protein product [Discosporangium mesarthrocarpum]